MAACFFHPSQSLYRKVQVEGLQVAYNNKNGRKIKDFTHKLVAFAFVVIRDVECYLTRLKRVAPQEMKDYIDYFDGTYVNEIPARGRWRAVRPRYLIHIWNQQYPTVDAQTKTTMCRRGGITD